MKSEEEIYIQGEDEKICRNGIGRYREDEEEQEEAGNKQIVRLVYRLMRAKR